MIDVVDVTKRYGPTTAVDGVSFHVGAGEIVGFLGPNGAGKSTLLKLITGELIPTAGNIRPHPHLRAAAAPVNSKPRPKPIASGARPKRKPRRPSARP